MAPIDKATRKLISENHSFRSYCPHTLIKIQVFSKLSQIFFFSECRIILKVQDETLATSLSLVVLGNLLRILFSVMAVYSM